MASAPCPYCAYVLRPPPVRSRRCPSCRQQINVRRLEGRSVLLVDTAVPVFYRERRRTADFQQMAVERDRWLGLAGIVRAPIARRVRLAEATLSASVVDDARTLYLASAERAVRAARKGKRWHAVDRIRRQQAAEVYRDAGAPRPPPDDVIALHREAMLAQLRALGTFSQVAEVVSTRCCQICRADDRQTFRIATELATSRLPHAGCPKGLCKCQWWVAMPAPKAVRRKRRAKVTSAGLFPIGQETPDGNQLLIEPPPDGDGTHRPSE